MGLAPPWSSPLPSSRRVVPPLILRYLAYITEILLALSKHVITKFHEIKKKIPIPSNRSGSSRQRSISKRSIANSPRVSVPKFPFGNTRLARRHLGSSFRFAIGDCGIKQRLSRYRYVF